nr:hypothetical protein [Tanacetum cinerariifolium]
RRGRRVAVVVDRILWVSTVGDAVGGGVGGHSGGDKMGVVAGGVACCRRRGNGGWQRLWSGRRGKVAASDIVDRKTGSLFGFAGKSPPKKFSGGGWWLAAGIMGESVC